MYQAYKARIYPNAKQTKFINKNFGCVRFVWNYMLDKTNKEYKRRGELLDQNRLNRELTQIKNYYPWLKEADSVSLRVAIEQLVEAKEAFFKGHARYPKFKSRESFSKSYTTYSPCIHYKDGRLKLPKVGWMRIHNKRLPAEDAVIKRVTVSLNSAGEYHVSILVQEECQPLPPVNKAIGLDMGVDNFMVDSDGNVYENPKFFRDMRDKLSKELAVLSRKQRGSANYEKQRIKVAKIHSKIARQREHFHNCIIKKLIDENQIICIEDLKIKDMVKSEKQYANQITRNINTSILDVGWYDFTQKLVRKAEASGHTVIKVSTYFPSSQTCHKCGYINPATKNLRLRKWKCPQCGSVHDRDHNAAINILQEGLKMSKAA